MRLTPGDLAPIAVQDYDGDGDKETVALELDGLAEEQATASVRYVTEPVFTVVGFSAS